nr:immunoglobulin heavy chain junction region [Macaca mulatta]MOV51119.1 immunoglobulin heavy chain junction region [Macaca mulatta]MOV51231.1 immunoglobulin heavy chain junction region [Macaca mulatta]MOV51486.1 immunoglobulin heavy chain junction region [Macaca mulatta]MOV51519.1 immunoglobulin heavy chain junction region [Macaca mulatta]
CVRDGMDIVGSIRLYFFDYW